MTAPFPRYIQATTSLGTTAVPASSSTVTQGTGSGGSSGDGKADVGDLCVIVQNGSNTNTSLGNTNPTYTSGGADAGFTFDQSLNSGGSGGRCNVWSKVLTSSDFSGGFLKQFTLSMGGMGTGRLQIYIFSHANGWDSSRAFQIVANTSSFTASAAQSLNDTARPAVVISAAGYVSSGATTCNAKWDGGTARAPYCDGSTGTTTTGGHTNHYGVSQVSGNITAQSDYNEYDSTDTISSWSWSSFTANSTHAFVVITYITASVPLTGSATDGHATTDAIVLAQNRALAETTSVSEIARGLATDARACTDSAPATDAATKSAARTITETAPATDTATPHAAPAPRAVTDSAPATDAATGTAGKTRAITDSAPATDAATRGIANFASWGDNAFALDNVTANRTVSRTAIESLTTSDAAAAFHGNVHLGFDAALASDFVTTALVGTRTLAETLTTSDAALARVGAQVRQITDSAPATDSITALGAQTTTSGAWSGGSAQVTADWTISDGHTITDAITLSGRYARQITDRALASDVLAGGQGRQQIVNDFAHAVDIAVRIAADARGITDNAPATDAVLRALTASITDVASASDAIALHHLRRLLRAAVRVRSRSHAEVH